MIAALSSLSLLLASLSLVSAAPHEQPHGLVKKSHHAVAVHHHQKRFPGRATWYDVGLGACGGYNVPSDYIVALNSHQLDTSVYPPAQCGRKVMITYQGKSAVATVQDECPGCPFGALDMSKGLFQHFTDLGTGEFTMNWDWTDGSDDNNNNNDDDKTTTTKAKPKTTTTTTQRTTTTTPKATTTTTTTTESSSSSSSSSSTTSTTTSSAASSSASPTNDDNSDDKGDDTVSNIANQQQFIANLGSMSSFGRLS